ncbi:styrene monooxygenase/indole monooxygenase family protein [Nonomuraea sp. NPDC050153]|uniref:styrene monooxygenase/indole monooxygenase family protein n=1 Tax=Nonomuraea sp. NPDC050153 TaxID=3364359 RepID=UPI0037A57273
MVCHRSRTRRASSRRGCRQPAQSGASSFRNAAHACPPDRRESRKPWAAGPESLTCNISPGCGEIFRMPIVTRRGVVSSVLVAAVPGGPLEPISRLPAAEVTGEPAGLLAEHAPRPAERMGEDFELLGEDDLPQGAITPVVREAVAELPSGRIAPAVGDARITNDPLTGQGANLGPACAWIAADAIAAGGPYDAAFGRATAERMWEAAAPVTDWTDAFLRPPAAHVMTLLPAATTRQDLADLILDLFSNPAYAWAVPSSPEEVSRIVDGSGPAL